MLINLQLGIILGTGTPPITVGKATGIKGSIMHIPTKVLTVPGIQEIIIFYLMIANGIVKQMGMSPGHIRQLAVLLVFSSQFIII